MGIRLGEIHYLFVLILCTRYVSVNIVTVLKELIEHATKDKMVRLTRVLRFGSSRILKFGGGGKDMPEMSKINTHMPGLDKESVKHNWSLIPLFVCSVIGSIVASRYIWHLVKPSKDTENYMEPYIFAFKFFGDNRVPMHPKIKKEGEASAKKE